MRAIVVALGFTGMTALVGGCGASDSTSPGGAPSAPTGLVATATDGTVTLSWSGVASATTYHVKRGTTSGAAYATVQSGISAPTFTNTGLTNGTTYYYVVTAGNDAGESAHSNEVAATPSSAPAQGTARQVTQYGIVWSFDQPHPVGQFANGDWWVAGPVTLVSITPDASPGRNGWDVNPTRVDAQPYDSRADPYTAAPQPSLPLTVAANSSVVKTISLDPTASSCRPCLRTAAVLTVLAAVPPDNGATSFRPPYFGTAKPLYSTLNLRTDLLPSLAAPAGTVPTLASIADRYRRVQLDHLEDWVGRAIHPSENMPDYGADIARDAGDAALRLMLSDPVAAKAPALINYLQHGIDLYHMRLGGLRWPANGGHASGRKLPMSFTAVVLDNQAMKSAVSTAPYNTFAEDGQLYFSPVADGGRGRVLWGQECREDEYWLQVNVDQGTRDCRDPYGYIDGGGTEVGGSYQFCCTSMAWKGTALVLHLMPSVSAVWNSDLFLSYVDRWVTFGAWAAPDPCALQDPVTYTGTCVPGTGRVPAKHGSSRDAGYYHSPFANAMWLQYR